MRKPGQKLHQVLYFQVLVAVVLGIIVGYFAPEQAVKFKPLGDGFIKLIKMMIAPIIFCTVVTGIAGMQDMKKVGRVGLKALLYFEIVSTASLIIGLAIVNWVRPGEGMNVNPASLDTHALTSYTVQAQSQSVVDFLLNIIPTNIADAFAKGDVLQILLIAILFGFALSHLGERIRVVLTFIEQLSHVLFKMVGYIMYLAPLGAFGAMAFTVGKQGVASLGPLAWLMGSFYATCLIFVFGVLGLIARMNGFNILQFVRYISEELFLVLGTSSSESALPGIMAKLENLGCGRSVVGLVIPAGYSFNLDGTSIYLTMAAIFVAQATNSHLTIWHQLTILAVLLISSKGAAGVTGSGFITLAATLAAVPSIPVSGLVLILGIDRFMSEARALTNLVGNGVATIVVARWEGEYNEAKAQAVLGQHGG
jgi:aerobic C4-dicarboxylate transport protein